jgi:hypothetical protein
MTIPRLAGLSFVRSGWRRTIGVPEKFMVPINAKSPAVALRLNTVRVAVAAVALLILLILSAIGLIL